MTFSNTDSVYGYIVVIIVYLLYIFVYLIFIKRHGFDKCPSKLAVAAEVSQKQMGVSSR